MKGGAAYEDFRAGVTHLHAIGGEARAAALTNM
jgi:hypothetical protein